MWPLPERGGWVSWRVCLTGDAVMLAGRCRALLSALSWGTVSEGLEELFHELLRYESPGVVGIGSTVR